MSLTDDDVDAWAEYQADGPDVLVELRAKWTEALAAEERAYRPLRDFDSAQAKHAQGAEYRARCVATNEARRAYRYALDAAKRKMAARQKP